MKRILSLLFFVTLIFSLCACDYTEIKKLINEDFGESLDNIISEQYSDPVTETPTEPETTQAEATEAPIGFGSPEEIADKIVAHYNSNATLGEGETYVIFEDETETSNNQITFVLRFQSNNINAPANKLVDRIFVDTTTGIVTEEMRGFSWQLN